MSGLRHGAITFGVATFAGAVGAGLILSTASAQLDPFAAVMPKAPANPAAILAPAPIAPARGGSAAPGTRTGFLAVEQATGRSYAASNTRGSANLTTISTLPRSVAPFPLAPKTNNPKALAAKQRIVIPSYSLAIIRSGSVRASGMGQGSEIAQRATSISTVLVGVDDALAARLADEALADLVQRLAAIGVEVVTPTERDANPDMARLKSAGQGVKGANGWQVYGPQAAPLRQGSPLAGSQLSGASMAIALTDVSFGLNAVVLQPYLALDYEQIGGSGNRTYSGSASAGAEVKFVVRSLGANYFYGNARGKGSGPYGSIIGGGYASDELFGVMFEVDDRSDDVGIHNAFAQAGLSNMFRQSKYYGVEVSADRYAALARAAFQGLNSVIAAEVRKARG